MVTAICQSFARRAVQLALAGLVGAGVLLSVLPCPAARPNIVLFVTDDHGPDAGCYGNPVIRTPALDELASEGIRFTRAFSTTASCSASRSVILTGLYNHANAQFGHAHAYHHFRTYEDLKSLPVRLAEAGYRTARVGKLHVAPPEVYRFGAEIPGSPRSPVEMAENCRAFLEEAGEQPFFLYFCTADPHRSGTTPPGAAHAPDAFGNRPEGYPGVEEIQYDPDDVIVPSFLPDTPVCRAELAQYYQSVSRADQGLGQLASILRELNLYDNTLFVFTSDHGIAFPGAKTTTYEPGLRVPFVVRLPGGRQAGAICDAFVSLVDITPTLLAIAKASSPTDALHGRSLVPLFDDPRQEGWDEIYASHTFHEVTMYYPMRVVRTRRYKLIWNIAHPLAYPFASDLWEAPTWQEVYRRGPEARYGQRTVAEYLHRPKFELYDLESDPDETINLAGAPQHAKQLAELQEKLKQFQRRTDDPWILKWTYE